MGEKLGEILIGPHFGSALYVDTDNVRPGVEEPEFLEQHLKPAGNIPQNQKCLRFADGTDIFEQMNPLRNDVEVRIRITHGGSLNPILIQLHNAILRQQILPPLTDLQCFSLIAGEHCLMFFDTLPGHIVVQDSFVLTLLDLPPVVLLE